MGYARHLPDRSEPDVPVKRLAVAAICAALSLPALAVQVFYVDNSGSCGSRDGLSPVCGNGHGPWAAIDQCNTNLGTEAEFTGAECRVAGGTYTTMIRPNRRGTDATLRLTYTCTSPPCIISNTDTTIDLRDRSYVSVIGFTSERGTVKLWGSAQGNTLGAANCSTVTSTIPPSGVGASCGNIIDTLTVRDNTSQTGKAEVWSYGGSGNVLRNFTIQAPPTAQGALYIGSGVSNGDQEVGTLVQNGTVRGTRTNQSEITHCMNCTIDGVQYLGGTNHRLTIGSNQPGTFPDINNLTIKNSMFMGGAAGYFETAIYMHCNFSAPRTNVIGLTLLNNWFQSGVGIPAVDYRTALGGNIVIRGNIFGQTLVGAAPLLKISSTTPTPAAVWDIDYNAYVGAGNMAGSGNSFWWDHRTGSRDTGGTQYYPDKDGDGVLGTAAGADDFDNWQALGFDAHSIVIENTDFRASAAGYAAELWDVNAPFYAFPVQTGTSTAVFETDSDGADGVVTNDYVQYDGYVSGDDARRRVSKSGTTITITSGGALSATPVYGRWWTSWGITDPGATPAITFVPKVGSPVIDAGDVDTCGHPFSGVDCDIGPKEYPDTSSYLYIDAWCDGTIACQARVTDELANIDCGWNAGVATTTCAAYVTGSIPLDLTDPAGGLSFVRWTGDCASCGTDPSGCTLDMTTGPKTCSVLMGVALTVGEAAAVQHHFIPRPPP